MISIADIITQDPVAMIQLRAVRTLALPDWCIAAGFVRNRVWDHLHGIAPARAPVDIDVLFFDARRSWGRRGSLPSAGQDLHS
ncbi:MAG: nucleotidyltransferase family protein [Reyranellaceae bacterium]